MGFSTVDIVNTHEVFDGMPMSNGMHCCFFSLCEILTEVVVLKCWVVENDDNKKCNAKTILISRQTNFFVVSEKH